MYKGKVRDACVRVVVVRAVNNGECEIDRSVGGVAVARGHQGDVEQNEARTNCSEGGGAVGTHFFQ
jgi:hypothetical protein